MSHTAVSIRQGEMWVPVEATQVQRTHTAPGGCGAASFTVGRDAMVDAATLGSDALVRITDRRTGETLWSGRVEKATKLREGHQVACTGSAAELSRSWLSLPYLVVGSDVWEPAVAEPSSKDASVEPGAMLDGMTPGVTLKFPPGKRTFADRARAEITAFRDTDCTIGSVAGWADAGFESSRWRQRWHIAATGWQNIPVTIIPTETATRYSAASGSDKFPRGQVDMSVSLEYVDFSQETTYGEEHKTWAVWYGMRVFAERYTRDGGYQTQVTNQGIKPHWIVEDIIWRMSTVIARDEARTPSWTDPTDYAFGDLDLSESITPADVLTKVVTASNSSTWMLSPADETDGLHGLEIRDWGGLAYAVPSEQAEWDDTGDAAGYNRAAVEWTNTTTGGKKYSRLIRYPTATWARSDEWPELANIEDRERCAPLVKLTSEQATSTQAFDLARQIFLNGARPARGGKVTISEPIVDHRTGQTKYPWELEPGTMVWVPGEQQYLRCTQIDFDDDAGTATLTIGNPRMTTDELVARYTDRTSA